MKASIFGLVFFFIGNIFPIFLSGQSADFPIIIDKLELVDLKIGDGREVNLIYDILQDRLGFLWFGTFNGIVRYDGYELKHFEPDREAPGALKSKVIFDLIEDAVGNIWALSGNGIVHVYNQATDRFKIIDDLDGDSVLRISFKTFTPMISDEAGNIWMAGQNGLLKFNYDETGNRFKVKRYRHDPKEDTAAANTIHTMLLDNRNKLWLGTETGLSYYDKTRDRIKQVKEGCSFSVISLIETNSGKLVLGSYDNGLCYFDPENKEFTHFSTSENEHLSLAGNAVKDLKKDGKGNIWLFAGSWSQQEFSLQRFDPDKGTFQTCFEPASPTKSFGGGKDRLFSDNDGYLWCVTSNRLIKFDPYRNVFTDFSGGEEFHDFSIINKFYQDRTGVLWFGTFGEGLFKQAPSAWKFDVFIPSAQTSVKKGSFLNFPVFEDSLGFLWAGTHYGTDRYAFDQNNELRKIAAFPFISQEFRENGQGSLFINTNEGLKCFDLQSGRFAKNLDLPFQIRPPFAFSLIDKEGKFWFNTLGSGLYFFHPASGISGNFRRVDGQTGSLSSDLLNPESYQDDDGNIWVTTLAGLNCYYPEADSFTTWLEHVEVMHIHEAKEGIFWLSTNGQGLYRFDKNTGAHKRYHQKNGFPVRTLFSILEDDHGCFWIPSDVGLVWFDPGTEDSRLYDASDGIPATYFAQSASCKRKNGEMLFPLTDGGFIRFHPDSLKTDKSAPPIAITGFKLFHKEVTVGTENSPLTQSIWTTDHLLLKHNENVFSLEFAALHFAVPEANRFAYNLEGLDKDWHEAGNQRTVNFAGLPPGQYTFRLKAANPDGIWSDESRALKITILPPWWSTWWAFSLYCILIGAVLWFGYTFQRRRWHLQYQLAEEHREAERLKELDAVKTRLYTNITHEFRTPLTIILGVAEQINETAGQQYHEALNMIKRSGNNLLNLVNQILDLSKLESGSMPVNLIKADILTYLKYILESFHSMAAAKGVRLDFKTNLKHLIMDYDPEKMLNIVSNLLSNAIKFTPEGGAVELAIQELHSATSDLGAQVANSMKLTVKDTGAGIPGDKLPYIFDRFYQLEDAPATKASGTGIGLALTKELVKLLNGQIFVESEFNKGTAFIILLPITRNAKPVADIPGGLQFIPEPDSNDEPSLLPGSDEIAHSAAVLPLLLIVEDNSDVVLYLKSILKADYRLDVAVNGQAGWKKALKFVPDIIVSDVMMPVMDGFELCDKLKKDIRTSHIPVILLTARVDLSSRIEGLERGADAYLAKPFNKEELQVRLQKLVESRKLLQERYSTQSQLDPSEDLSIQIEDAFMTKFKDLLETHFSDENFGISDLCKALLMSRAQLYRKVAALTGKPAASYLRSFRMHKARTFLQTTSLTVSEIAFRVGFKDLGHFSRTFRKEFGTNPSDSRH